MNKFLTFVATNAGNGKIMFFHSQGFCAKFFGVASTTIANMIKYQDRNGYKNVSGWKFTRESN